jgi:diguanylate cyclase (GGDEF)-like protein
VTAPRSAARIAAATLVAGLVVFLLLNVRSIDSAAHSRVIGNLSKMQELDSVLSDTVQKLHDALLTNYDPLVATLGLIKLHQRDLEQGLASTIPGGDAELEAATAAVAAQVTLKESLIEQFKSRNALLRNSFHYFPLSVDHLSAQPVQPATRSGVHGLMRDVLLLRMDPSDTSYERIVRGIATLRQSEPGEAPPERARLRTVLLHSQNLVTHQREVGELLVQINAIQVNQALHTLTDAYSRRFERTLKQANLFRFVLIVVSMGLLAYAIHSFLQLRRNAVALQGALEAQAKEIAERQRTELALRDSELRYRELAHHDALTGLPNRILFEDRLQEALHRARRHGRIVGLLFIDLDRFKDINDSLGHGAGDQLLKAVTARLKHSLRESDTVARLGGDEFTVLLDELGTTQSAGDVAAKLRSTLAAPFMLGEHQVTVTASIGISCFPQDGPDPLALLKNADAAMYRAKDQGRDGFQFFSSQMNADSLDRLVMTNELRGALERGEFLLDYQPIVDLASGEVCALEALVRWNHPVHGLVPPARFIPLAENSALIVPIGDWVLKTACAQMKEWLGKGFALRRMAVNLSARQFKDKDLGVRIPAILRETGLAPEFLELELTESMVMEHPEEAARVMHALHRSGIRLAIDDFGTGYSSLSYLKRFPIDFLKIDRSFIHDIPEDADDIAITKAILALARNLNLRVIAEGVETAQQHAFLRAEGCDEAQGYLLCRPAAPREIERFLASYTPRR